MRAAERRMGGARLLVGSCLVLVFLVLFAATTCEGRQKRAAAARDLKDSIEQTVPKLMDFVLKSQIQISTPYIPPFISEEKMKGLFPSYVHLNFHGGEMETQLRHLVKFFDNNMFVTNWILQVLLEFESYDVLLDGVDEAKVVDVVNKAMTALIDFQDRNRPTGTPIYCFWKQILENGTWVAFPTNIAKPLEEEESFAMLIEKFLKFIGLEKYIPKVNSLLVTVPDELLSAFLIPADTDDTSCNLALGGWLTETSNSFTSAHNAWLMANINFTALADAYVKYSYRPFSSDFNENTIDPRTFYWMREFLYQEQQAAAANNTTPDLSLISTWLENISEDEKSTGVKMPFNDDNVDVTVCANSVYGLTRAWFANISNPTSWMNDDLFKLYSDTARLISWSIDSEVLVTRPDLCLLYYPPTYDFYWFVSRSVFLLNSQAQAGAELPPAFQIALDVLTNSMRGSGTDQLLDASQFDEANSWLYWDDFVGDNDTVGGQRVIRGEDRIFSTSVALLALMDAWTIPNGQCKRQWLDETPESVLTAVDQGISFVLSQVLADDYLKENAFFSGSVKGSSTLPFSYPANFHGYVNGTILPPNPPASAINPSLISLVTGIIPPEEYEQMIESKPFGFTTPTEFDGFNQPGDVFPYWSSPPFTYATSLLALARYYILSGCN